MVFEKRMRAIGLMHRMSGSDPNEVSGLEPIKCNCGWFFCREIEFLYGRRCYSRYLFPKDKPIRRLHCSSCKQATPWFQGTEEAAVMQWFAAKAGMMREDGWPTTEYVDEATASKYLGMGDEDGRV